jgi:translation initiation factor IF-1
MPKEDAIRVRAQVLSPLGVAAHRVRLANGHHLVAHVPLKLQPEIGPVRPGDVVELELSPFDLSRGRVLGRSAPGQEGDGRGAPAFPPVTAIRTIPPVAPIGPVGGVAP